MAKFNTGNPLGSTDPRDLLDNATILDHYVDDTDSESWPDRFGSARRTWHGIEMDSSRQLSSQEERFQQFLLSSGYVILPDYIDGPVTFTARNQVTAYNGEYYRPKAGLPLPFTTTGVTSESFQSDEVNFVAVGDAVFRQEIAEGNGKLVGVTGNKTLEELSKNAPYYSGVDIPVHNNWKAGATSLYTTVWKWTDGSYWWGCNGNLPDSPSVYNMRRYNPFGDPVNIRSILANIFFQDRTANSTLWNQFISGVMKRIPIATNTTYMGGDGTIENALGIKPAMQLLGQLAWPDQSLSGATLIETLSSSEASGWGVFAGKWNLSTPSALSIGTDTGSCAVYTGHLASKKLFRLVIANSGRMYIKIMSGNFVWGSYYEVYSTLNTTKSSSGVLSAASPIVRIVDTVATTERIDLLEDTFTQAGDYGAANEEALGCTVTKEGVGVYRIKGCKSLASSGWQVRDPFPLQGSTALGFAEGVTQDDGSVLIYLYKRKLTLDSSSGEITESKGDAMDVPANSWVDVRLDMPEVVEDEDDTTNVVITEGGVDING